jgi:hypothetical protein
LLDLLAQRWLGHKQPFRCAGDVSFGSDGGKVAQEPGVDIHAIRLWPQVVDAGLAGRQGYLRVASRHRPGLPGR